MMDPRFTEALSGLLAFLASPDLDYEARNAASRAWLAHLRTARGHGLSGPELHAFLDALAASPRP